MVSYNLTFLRKYNAHINVEICNRIKFVKYLYKYIQKGEDRDSNNGYCKKCTKDQVDKIMESIMWFRK